MDFIFDPSLVLYLPLYKLDGSSFMSEDAYGHLCAVTGAIWTPRGRSFDGLDDVINCGSSTVLNPNDPLTVGTWEIWINPVSPLSGATDFFRKGSTYEVGSSNLATGKFGMYDFGGLGWLLTTNAYVTATKWQHLAWVKSGISLHLYYNGDLKETKTCSASWAATSDALSVGDNAVSSASFGGISGEVRIYQRALTPQEIQHNYLATKWRYR